MTSIQGSKAHQRNPTRFLSLPLKLFLADPIYIRLPSFDALLLCNDVVKKSSRVKVDFYSSSRHRIRDLANLMKN